MPVFCPRITYFKKTRSRGRTRFTEALFPGYLFVRCVIGERFRHLLAIEGVSGVVRYGDAFPTVPEDFVGELKERLTGECREVNDPVLSTGSEVVVTEGPFADLRAVISGLVPARERVRVLLEFLGRQIKVEVAFDSVIAADPRPRERVWEDGG
jgi:transcriptional antiterminator RfaH